MGVIKLGEGIYSVGVLNPSMRVFDIIMETEYGTSYNAYLLTGEKNVLIDCVHARYFDEYIENVKSVIDPSDIDYIVVNHCEPDHTGSLERLLELAPGAQLLTSPAGKIYLPLITNQTIAHIKAVKNDETCDLGGGRTLRFIHAPFLHWPDSMFTWLESEKTVFTCDFLGTHFCEPTMSDRRVSYMALYEKSFMEYYNAIFSPFKPHVLNGLEKLSALDIETLCPSHGPALHKGAYLETAQTLYEQWSTPEATEKQTIPVFYCSAYGYTQTLAGEIAQGILHVLPDADVPVYDLTVHEPCKLACLINDNAAFASARRRSIKMPCPRSGSSSITLRPLAARAKNPPFLARTAGVAKASPLSSHVCPHWALSRLRTAIAAGSSHRRMNAQRPLIMARALPNH